ncbi:trypsin-like peptidase domain-containing protein [Kitasatospora sp. NPDC097691]|uniref:nSTAND1 domain-containing NTPase n=1 Tax=Kitasatospora sp. NPDC097691 TaxID=3157231 RepID=UPI003328C70C
MTPTPPGPLDGATPKALDAAVLRIHDALSRPVGAGFLVTPELAVTCAHVVSAALAGQTVEPGVGAWVFVDLPLCPAQAGPGAPGVAGVMAVVEHWAPRQPDGSGDVAVLRLAGPLAGGVPVRPVESQSEDLWDHPVRVFGFPVGRSDGVWHYGVLRGRQGSGWVQIDPHPGGYRVSGGFSGSPVWDERLGGVVGMVAVAEAGDPAVSYLTPTDGLMAAWPQLRALAMPPSPFRSLKAFEESDAQVFCGRQAESEDVAVRLARDQWVCVAGPSGSGKSSLALAGVVPRLRAAGALAIVLRPGSGGSPLSALAAALLPLLEPELSEIQRLERLSALTALLGAPAGLADIVPRILERHGAAELLVVVDQFEELLARGPAAVDEFAAVLFTDALPATVRVLTTLRADFLEAALAHPRLGPVISRQVYALGPMSREQLHEVVTAPVDAIPGVRYAPNLAERLLADTGSEPGTLPLLGFALDLLWQRQTGGLLTHQAYEELGGVKGALGAYADDVLKRTVSPEGEPVARRLLTRLVRIPMGSMSATRRTALRSELSEGEWNLARLLATSRLLVTARSAEGVETVELAHEALINAWDTLRAWVEEDRSFLAWREVLRHDRERWEGSGRDNEQLPTRIDLAGAEPWLRERKGDLSEAERDYLERGRLHHRSRRRRFGSGVATLCVLALLAATGVGLTVHERGATARQRDATARQTAAVDSKNLAGRAQALAAVDPGLASQLAVAAYQTSPTQEAGSRLYDLLGPLLNSVVGETGSDFATIAASARGTLVAAAAVDQDRTLRIWDLADPAAPRLRSTINAGGAGIALTPDGRHLAAACGTEGLCLWSLADPGKPAIAAHLPKQTSPAEPSTSVTSMATSADGTLLAAAAGNGDTYLWSIAQPSAPKALARLHNPTVQGPRSLAAVAFAPSGGLLATTVLGGTTQVWGLADPANPTNLSSLETGYKAVAFSPDGNLLAAASQRDVGLWRVGDPARPDPIRVGVSGSPETNISAVAFNRDSNVLAYAGTDTKDPKGDLCFASLSPEDTSLGTAKSTCTRTAAGTMTMTTVPTGGLLTAGADGVLRRWRSASRTVDGARLPGGLASWAFSPDGRLMAAPQEAPPSTPPVQTQSVGLWDLSTPDGPALVTTLPVSARGASFIRAGALLTIGWDGDIRLWNVNDPHNPVGAASLGTAAFPAVSTAVGDVILTFGVTSADNGHLVAVVGGGKLHLWRVGDGLDAVEVGSIPAPDAGGHDAGVLGHGRTAYLATGTGFDWWDISNPAKPRRAGSSDVRAPEGSADSGSGSTSDSDRAPNMGSAVSGPTPTGSVLAVTSTPDTMCKCAALELFGFTTGGEPTSKVEVPGAFGSALGLSGDGRLLAAGGNSGNTVSLWDVGDPQHPRPRTTIQTVQDVKGIEFAQNGTLMAAWSSSALELWDVRNPDSPVLVAPIANPSSTSIRAVAFASTGPTLLVASSRTVALLDADPANLATRLCSYSTGAISPSQWQKYAPGVAYRDPCPRR